MMIVLFEAIHVSDITFVMLVLAQFLLLLFRPFSAVGILSVEHGQILISNVVPTEITILPAEIRRLDGGQHVEQILFRPTERSVPVVQSDDTVGSGRRRRLFFPIVPHGGRNATSQFPPRIPAPPFPEIPLVVAAIARLLLLLLR